MMKAPIDIDQCEGNDSNSLYRSLLEIHSEITNQFRDMFKSLAFESRYSPHPRQMMELAEQEADSLFAFLNSRDTEAVKEHGKLRLRGGLGVRPLLAIGNLLRKICWDHFKSEDLDLLQTAVNSVDLYMTCYFEGYMNEEKAAILEDQEQLRHALSVALEAQRRELLIKQHAIDTSINGIMLTDLEGNIDYINPSFLAMWGYDNPDEVLGKNSRDFCTTGDSNEPIEALMKKKRGGWRRELKAQRKDGMSFELEIIASQIKDTQRNPIGIMLSFIDITERKHLEEEFRQAQKMEAIGTLAGGIAHDFNNLLMTIQGCTSLMLLDIDRSNSHYEKLKAIEQQVQSGADLTKHLLGFARRGRYNVQPTDLNDLVERTCSMFGRTRKEITIHKKYQKDIWTVEVDRGQIEQALLNLYVNAGQAMPGGGDLYIETRNVTLDKKYAKPYDIKPGRYLKVSVTDTGFGMDEATHKRIFEPFFTTKEMGRGTGLGLASVYGIIKNHGGAINVTSQKGHGTTFRIYLPTTTKEVKKEARLSSDVVGGTDTILLVDDEEAVLDWTGQLIKALGYTVLEARSGEEAISIYKKNREMIDLVILDMVMPGMGGGETFDILKRIEPDVKVLLSSGYSIDGEAAKIMERGCHGFIPKPFNIKELSEKIMKILKAE